MDSHVERISIKGFKAFKDTCVDLKDLNIIIGANGVGKSNFIQVFHHKIEFLDEASVLPEAVDHEVFVTTWSVDVPECITGQFFDLPVVFYPEIGKKTPSSAGWR